MNDAIPENALYISPEQLCIGLYIHLDLHWMQHPFTFSSFKIKNQAQIDTIRELGLNRIRYEPAKSDQKPLPAAPKSATAPQPAPNPAEPVEESPAIKEKKERMEQLNHIRNRIGEVEKQFQQASDTVRNLTRNLFSKPEESRRQAEELVGMMVESMLSESSVLMHAINGKAGEDAYFHSLNVTVLCLMLAKILGMGSDETKRLGMGAMFHDIGKLEIPSKILLKTDPLTSAEQSFLEQHCAYGVSIAEKIGLPQTVSDIILQHHEYIDGTGYPKQLRGNQLSPLSKIVAIVNVYDNMCNPVNLAEALTPHEALSQMFALKRGKFEEVPLKAFIRCLGVYPPGSIVQLSNDLLGLVISVNPSKPLKPNVLVYDPAIPKDQAVIINMEKETELNISKSLRPGQLPREVYHYLNPRKRVTYYFDPQNPNEPM